jgi:uncharacterized protein YlxW (UPF0749 family)
MCVVSFVGDFYSDKWKEPFKKFEDFSGINIVTRLEHENLKLELSKIGLNYELLKNEVAEMKELLKRAKAYDEKNNEPNCEMEDKVALLKKIAELVGVDLSEIFKPKV